MVKRLEIEKVHQIFHVDDLACPTTPGEKKEVRW